MSIIAITNTFFSFVTAATAIISIVYTNKQLRMSNKQKLFERRLELYNQFNCLYKSYKETGDKLIVGNEKEKLLGIDVPFLLLTNNVLLESVQPIIKQPEETYIQRNFLLKVDELHAIASQIKFLYKESEFEIVFNFIEDYTNLLKVMYKYIQLLKIFEKDTKKEIWANTVDVNIYGEQKIRDEIIKFTNQVETNFNLIDNKDLIQKMENEISLGDK